LKILHLYSDWKWTGPAEPALNLCVELKKRGYDITFACGKADDALMLLPESESVEKYASERGLVPVTKFCLSKHFSFFKHIYDIKKLSSFMNEGAYDIVHVHRNQDHLVGGIAAKLAKRDLPIVRTSHDGVALKRSLRNRICFSKLTDRLITVSEEAKNSDAKNFGLPVRKITRINASIDCQRFSPGNGHVNTREKWGIKEDDVVVHTGYRTKDYVDVVSCMDFNIFLVPGSDGSCRAVREVMAMGKPVIAANRGMLSEIVENNTTGFVIEDTTENLATAILKLAKDECLRKRLAEASLKRAQEKFSSESMAAQVEEVYEELLNF